MEKEKQINIQETQQAETAVLVAVIRERQENREAEEYLEELQFLAETAGIESVGQFTQKLAYPDKRTFVGSGKLQEIKAFVE